MGLPGVKTDRTNLDPGEVCILIIKPSDITLWVLFRVSSVMGKTVLRKFCIFRAKTHFLMGDIDTVEPIKLWK